MTNNIFQHFSIVFNSTQIATSAHLDISTALLLALTDPFQDLRPDVTGLPHFLDGLGLQAWIAATAPWMAEAECR